MNNLILSCDADIIPLLNHLFGKREWTQEQIRMAGSAVHLTTSDAERGYKLSQLFGEIKPEDWSRAVNDYEKKSTR